MFYFYVRQYLICLLCSFPRPWLEKNIKAAAEKQAACYPLQEEVKRLQIELAEYLGLKEIIWDCGWNVTHFRGCLQSFQALARDHPEQMEVLKGRVFRLKQLYACFRVGSVNDLSDSLLQVEL